MDDDFGQTTVSALLTEALAHGRPTFDEVAYTCCRFAQQSAGVPIGRNGHDPFATVFADSCASTAAKHWSRLTKEVSSAHREFNRVMYMAGTIVLARQGFKVEKGLDGVPLVRNGHTYIVHKEANLQAVKGDCREVGYGPEDEQSSPFVVLTTRAGEEGTAGELATLTGVPACAWHFCHWKGGPVHLEKGPAHYSAADALGGKGGLSGRPETRPWRYVIAGKVPLRAYAKASAYLEAEPGLSRFSVPDHFLHSLLAVEKWRGTQDDAPLFRDVTFDETVGLAMAFQGFGVFAGVHFDPGSDDWNQTLTPEEALAAAQWLVNDSKVVIPCLLGSAISFGLEVFAPPPDEGDCESETVAEPPHRDAVDSALSKRVTITDSDPEYGCPALVLTKSLGPEELGEASTTPNRVGNLGMPGQGPDSVVDGSSSALIREIAFEVLAELRQQKPHIRDRTSGPLGAALLALATGVNAVHVPLLRRLKLLAGYGEAGAVCHARTFAPACGPGTRDWSSLHDHMSRSECGGMCVWCAEPAYLFRSAAREAPSTESQARVDALADNGTDWEEAVVLSYDAATDRYTTRRVTPSKLTTVAVARPARDELVLPNIERPRHSLAAVMGKKEVLPARKVRTFTDRPISHHDVVIRSECGCQYHRDCFIDSFLHCHRRGVAVKCPGCKRTLPHVTR